MFQCFVCLFVIHVFLALEATCGSMRDEFDSYTIDSLNLTMDFDVIGNLSSILGPNCESTELNFKFEVDLDELIPINKKELISNKNELISNKPYTNKISYKHKNDSESNEQNKVLIITICSAAAVAMATVIFIYGRKALLSCLQSKTYIVSDNNTPQNTFQELTAQFKKQ